MLDLRDVRPADVRPADVRPADVRPADIRPADIRPADIRDFLNIIPLELNICKLNAFWHEYSMQN